MIPFHPLANGFRLRSARSDGREIQHRTRHSAPRSLSRLPAFAMQSAGRRRFAFSAAISPTCAARRNGSSPKVTAASAPRSSWSRNKQAILIFHRARKNCPAVPRSARLLNVGHASVERAKAVQRDGIAELQSAVERGDVSVSTAADIATYPDLPVSLRRAAAS